MTMASNPLHCIARSAHCILHTVYSLYSILYTLFSILYHILYTLYTSTFLHISTNCVSSVYILPFVTFNQCILSAWRIFFTVPVKGLRCVS